MKKYLFLFIFTLSFSAFAQEEPVEFMIEFNRCVRTINPFVFHPMTVNEIQPNTIRCMKTDKLFFCNMGNNESLYFERNEKDPNLSLDFGSGNMQENIHVKDRIATYTKSEKSKYFVNTVSCQGIYTTKQHLQNIKRMNLNLGFKNIKKKL